MKSESSGYKRTSPAEHHQLVLSNVSDPSVLRIPSGTAMSSPRPFSCKHSPDSFCYVCGQYDVTESLRPINDRVKQLYSACFGLAVKEGKPWAPSEVCTTCIWRLEAWSKDRRRLPFETPMLWSEQADHAVDCYFCATKVRGMNRKNRNTWKYPVVASARLPRPHSGALPAPDYEEPAAAWGEQFPASRDPSSSSGESFQADDSGPKLFNQEALNDLVRDLRLPKDAAELLASRLRERNLLTSGMELEEK